jgi:DNA-binding protein HU-beta
MNKRDLIDAISSRMGDRKTATEAVNAVLETIQSTVAKGDKVSITGFGVFEKTIRPARTARNPATGATIRVPRTSVPKFRAGSDFKAVVSGEKKTGARR